MTTAPLTVSPVPQRQAEAAKAAEAILNDPAKSLAYLSTPTEGSTRLKQMQMEIDNPHHRGMIDASVTRVGGRNRQKRC